MISKTAFVCALLALVGSVRSFAQSEPSQFFTVWEDRVRDTLAQQPAWPIPLVTASSGLLQVARTDIVRQITSAETETWNYDNTKGIAFVPWYGVTPLIETERKFPGCRSLSFARRTRLLVGA
jgi:hypothetical protein